MRKQNILVLVLLFCCLLFPSCVNKMAMNMVANALTGDGGTDVFTGDPDPQLVGDAIPFAIKMYEALLSQNPTHQGLMLTTGSLFIMYANAFVQGPAEMFPHYEWQERQAALTRAKQLYLRGYEILYNALESKYRGFKQAVANDDTRESFLGRIKKNDVDLLYWAVAGGLSAYSIDILDFELSTHVPEWNAMIHRAYTLNPNYGGWALNEFFIIFYASLPEVLGGDMELAKYHFDQAVEKSRGTSTGAYLSYAQFISVPEQDYDSYKYNLEKVLEINPDDDIPTRLVNVINQQKARWLLDNAWLSFSFLPIPGDF